MTTRTDVHRPALAERLIEREQRDRIYWQLVRIARDARIHWACAWAESVALYRDKAAAVIEAFHTELVESSTHTYPEQNAARVATGLIKFCQPN